MPNSRYQPFKRLLDILGSLTALIVFSPLFVVVAILIKCFQGGHVFYAQERIGLRGKTFRIYKFTSMTPDADRFFEQHPEAYQTFVENGYKFPEGQDPRVTKIGKFLRQTTIDELPQFFNILKGDMSIVGPRPITADELKQEYGKRAKKLLSVRPGAMGLWQANGRSRIVYPERAEYELAYVHLISFWLDVKIFLKNLWSIFRGDGAF